MRKSAHRTAPSTKEHGRLGEFPHRRLPVAVVLVAHHGLLQVARRGLPGDLLAAGDGAGCHGLRAFGGTRPPAKPPPAFWVLKGIYP